MNYILDEKLVNEWWENYLHRLGKMDLNLLPYRPDFIVISPVKTGTTWLFQNLLCHSEIFIPVQKEVRYFSHCWKWLDINWYLNQFMVSEQVKKGDISPAYLILPEKVIKLISKLMPELKIIFLMRDPVERAWSHAKYNYKYHQVNFEKVYKDFDTIPEEKWLENFDCKGSLLYNDYPGSLKRWLAFFPKNQFYLGFYDDIKNNPRKLLMDIFKFLNVTQEVDWSKFPLSKRILSGIEREIPEKFKKYLASIYVKRLSILAELLKNEFNMNIPYEWEYILTFPEAEERELLEQANYFDIEKPRLKKILLWWQKGANMSFCVETGYKGFNIAIYMDKYYAFSNSLGHIYIPGIDEETLEKYEKEHKFTRGYTLEEVKEKVCTIVQ
ncbi:MAG: sulfotransferase domain-containing protein [Candidatus Eremiobacterota bacterium]